MRAALLVAILAAPVAAQDAAPPVVGRYLCEDRRAVDAAFVRLGERDLAVLSVDGGEPVLLQIAPSASGARYVGAGLQWWGKGLEEANLAPLEEGADIASDPGIACRAE